MCTPELISIRMNTGRHFCEKMRFLKKHFFKNSTFLYFYPHGEMVSLRRLNQGPLLARFVIFAGFYDQITFHGSVQWCTSQYNIIGLYYDISIVSGKKDRRALAAKLFNIHQILTWLQNKKTFYAQRYSMAIAQFARILQFLTRKHPVDRVSPKIDGEGEGVCMLNVVTPITFCARISHFLVEIS